MKTKKPLDVTMSLRLPTYLHKELKEENAKTYKSINLLIIEAIQDYLPTK